MTLHGDIHAQEHANEKRRLFDDFYISKSFARPRCKNSSSNRRYRFKVKFIRNEILPDI